jgi:NADH dehydrogenase FAD-containing subunit
LIVGGGLIGTEVAGELCSKDECEVTVVHPMDRLIERNPSRASMAALRFLRKRGVKVVFGERVVDRAGEHFLTDKNKTVDADICFWCAGIKSDVGFLSEAFAGAVTEKRTIAVNEYLQVVGFPNVFAGGDVTNIVEEKTAQNAERHGVLIAKNIVRLAREKPLLPYHHHVGPLVISLGDWHGLFVWRGFVWAGVLPALLKRAIEWWCLFSTRYL